jgi:hypothetical protein
MTLKKTPIQTGFEANVSARPMPGDLPPGTTMQGSRG